MAKTKILLKILHEDKDAALWTHLCYVDSDLYNAYIEHFNVISSDLNGILARWIQETLNVEMVITKKRDLEIARGLIKDYYSRVYPEIYIESESDRQGWMRVFVTQKMKEDLGPYYGE